MTMNGVPYGKREHYFDDRAIEERVAREGGMRHRYRCACGWKSSFLDPTDAYAQLAEHLLMFKRDPEPGSDTSP